MISTIYRWGGGRSLAELENANDSRLPPFAPGWSLTGLPQLHTSVAPAMLCHPLVAPNFLLKGNTERR